MLCVAVRIASGDVEAALEALAEGCGGPKHLTRDAVIGADGVAADASDRRPHRGDDIRRTVAIDVAAGHAHATRETGERHER